MIFKPCMKKIDKEFISVGDLVDFINKNHVSPNTMIWIDFGDGNGTFLRHASTDNWRTNDGITSDDGTLRLNLSPSSLKWHEIDVLHPVVLSNDKCKY